MSDGLAGWNPFAGRSLYPEACNEICKIVPSSEERILLSGNSKKAGHFGKKAKKRCLSFIAFEFIPREYRHQRRRRRPRLSIRVNGFLRRLCCFLGGLKPGQGSARFGTG